VWPPRRKKRCEIQSGGEEMAAMVNKNLIA